MSDRVIAKRAVQPEYRTAHQAGAPELPRILPAVLFIDDNEELLARGKIHLERTGRFSVDTIASAVSAIEEGNLAGYDAILSDCHMPGMDGIAFLQYVREHYGDIPVILLTSDYSSGLVLRAIDAGAFACIRKSTEVNDMFRALEYLLVRAIERCQIRDRCRSRQVPVTGIGRSSPAVPGSLVLFYPLSKGCLCCDPSSSIYHYVRGGPQEKGRPLSPRFLSRHARILMRTRTVERELREPSGTHMRDHDDYGRI